MDADEDDRGQPEEDAYASTEVTFCQPHNPLPISDEAASQPRAPSEDVKALWDKWFPGREPGQIRWDGVGNITDLFMIFGIDPSQPLDPTAVNGKFKELSTEAATVLNTLQRSGDIRRNNNDGIMRMIFKKLEAARTMLLGIVALHSADTMQPSDLPRDDFGLWRFIPPATDEEPNPGQRLRIFALDDAMKSGFRRYRKALMHRIMSNGYPTCAWEPIITIEDYVRSLTSRRLTDPSIWFDMTTGGGWGPAKQLAEYLQHSDDPEVPWLEPDRHIFSFQNGVYLAKDELFVPYVHIQRFFRGGEFPVACKHFGDQAIDPEWLLCTDPMSIPTPALDEIFRTQKLSPNVCRWTLTLFGRLLYDVGELDDWQVFPFIKGLAGTGKSVLLNHIKRVYDAQDVGVISNMIEKQFGFSQVAGKFIGVADDVRSSFQLDQSDFQNACSGNAVSVAVKFKDAVIVDPWKTALILSGNEPPGYHDNSGSYGRRMAVIAFLYIVTNPDGSMAHRLMQEMGAFICKCNRMYRNMLRRFGSKGIWNILPQEFKNQRAELTATSNALVGFMSSPLIIRGPALFMPISILRHVVMDYARDNNLEKPHWGPDYYRGPIVQDGFRLTSKAVTKEYHGRSTHDTFVLGCDLASAIASSASSVRPPAAADDVLAVRRVSVGPPPEKRPNPADD